MAGSSDEGAGRAEAPGAGAGSGRGNGKASRPPVWPGLLLLVLAGGPLLFSFYGGGGVEPVPAPEDLAAPPEEAIRHESGLASRVLREGTGHAHPLDDSEVLVHYTGWTTDGETFDSSVARGEPVWLPLDGVIPGWREGVREMVVGEKRRLWIPEELAYRGRPGAPAGMLVFDIELLDMR